jgi:catechol 2,3-dioxygenase-like lactoylglutathione lyase family enzyme
MPIQKLAHYSIRTRDLERSKRFYEDILGFRAGYRPPFPFPGIWLYQGGDEAEFGVVHIIGIDDANPGGLSGYLGNRAEDEQGTGTLDHIAVLATGLADMQARLRADGREWTERTVPSLGLHQLFVVDPSGVTIELNYPATEAS